MRFPRASFIPKQAVKVSSKASSAVAYLYSLAGKFYAVGFYGKADKPAFHYSFRDDARRTAYVAKWMRDMDACAVHKAERVAEKRAKMAAPHGLKVGDVLCCSWGYDQTNIDYYQVIELAGRRSVLICEIGCESVETLSMQGESVPAVGNFTGKPMRKMVNEWGAVRIASYACASKMEPVKVAGVAVGFRPSHWTAYA